MEQTTTINQENLNTGQFILESKKHFSTYIIPTILIILGFIFLLSMLSKVYFMGIVGIIFLIIVINKILSNISTKWILFENELIIKSGFLPWRKSFFAIPIDNIFEAYYQHDFFAHIFKYGHLNIRRTEGSTSSFRTTSMTQNKEITGTINSMVRSLKSYKVQNSHSNSFQNNSNLSDELTKLGNLRNQGILSEEEFQIQKQKLLNQ